VSSRRRHTRSKRDWSSDVCSSDLVFGDGSNKKSWDELKRAEKKDDDEYLLDGVIRHAPSLEVAYELQKKAARVGFDWDNAIDMRSEERRVGKRVDVGEGRSSEQDK